MDDTKPNDQISIIVPTLNEENNLLPLFERINDSLKEADIEYEIIVVDDHSSDKTASVAENADQDFHVRLLMKQGMRGKAYSLIQGFNAARFPLVCMIDADLQYPPEDIALMYQELNNQSADVVVTERVDNKTGPLRKLSSYIFNLIFTRMLFGINYDTQSGLKLFRKKVIDSISISPSPWSFDLEFIIKSLEKGYTILNHKIKFAKRYSGVPKVKMLSATKELMFASIRLRRNTSPNRIRKIKYNYSQLQIGRTQRSHKWQAMLLVLASVPISLLFFSHTSALGLINSVEATKVDLQYIIGQVSSPNKTSSPPASQSSSPATDKLNTPTTASTSTQPSASSPTASSTPTQQLNSSNLQSAPATQANPGNISVDNSSQQPENKNTAVAPTNSYTSPITSSLSDNSQPASYYPDNKLSSDETHHILNLTLLGLLLGIILLLMILPISAVRSIFYRPAKYIGR